MSGFLTAASVVSAVVGGYSAYQQGEAQKAQAAYQSELATYNAQVAEGNAQIAELEGQEIKKQAYEDSLTKRQEAAAIVGTQRAQQAASGVAVDVGSALDLNLDTVEKGELDALAIQEQGAWADYNKRVEAWNFRTQGSALQSQSSMYTNQANSTNSFLNAGGTLLGGLSQAGSNYYNMTKK